MTRILWLAVLCAYGFVLYGWWIIAQVLHAHVSLSAI